MAKDVRPLGHHPVSAAVARLRDRVADVADVPLWSMDASEAAATLTHLTALAAQVAELELRVAGHAQSVAAEEQTGASSTAVWWAAATNQDRATACGRMRLAEALDRYPLVRDGLAAGDVTVEQARVIVQAPATGSPTTSTRRCSPRRRRCWSATPPTTAPRACAS